MTLGGSDTGDMATLRRGSSEIMCASSALTSHPYNCSACMLVALECAIMSRHRFAAVLFHSIPLLTKTQKLLRRKRAGNHKASTIARISFHCDCGVSFVTICVYRMYVPAAPQPGSPIPPMPEPFEESEPTQLDLPRPFFGSTNGDLNSSNNRCAARVSILVTKQHSGWK